jgi:hypothetical protein
MARRKTSSRKRWCVWVYHPGMGLEPHPLLHWTGRTYRSCFFLSKQEANQVRDAKRREARRNLVRYWILPEGRKPTRTRQEHAL